MTTAIATTPAESPPHERGRPARPTRRGARRELGVELGIELGFTMLYLSIIVLLPLSVLVWSAFDNGLQGFWDAVTAPEAFAALELTVTLSAIVAVVNAGMGTLIAWVLVRDRFPGQRILETVIDLPFALPTIVAGIVLIALYGPRSPVGVDLAYQRSGVLVALLFVTLPFVVRTVEPVLIELDVEMEQAAASLGARPSTIFRRVVLPNLIPAIASGTALSFARAISEFGATSLISGNLPMETQVSAVQIYSQIESGSHSAAAAVSTVLLAIALAVMLSLDVFQRWARRRG